MPRDFLSLIITMTSPKRSLPVLFWNLYQDLLKNIGNIECVLAREITKIHEEFIRDNISNLLEQIQEPKGEYVILLDLNNIEDEDKEEISQKTVEEQYKIYESQGMSKKDIIKQIAKNKNVPKNEIYKLFI